MSKKAPTFSIVIPVFNESNGLNALFERLISVINEIPEETEVVLVDDGSSDGSFELCCRQIERDRRFVGLQLSRNFGHQAALSAGLSKAAGQAVITMDADLQDPPEVIYDLICLWRQGFEVVHAIRSDRGVDSLFKKLTAYLYYKIFNLMTHVQAPVNSADFRLLDRRAVDTFNSLKEKGRLIRGLVSWIGYRQASVYYERAERHSGETKYPLRKMISLAIDGIFSFSTIPLRLCTMTGIGLSLISLTFGVALIFHKAIYDTAVPGWASLAVMICLMGGVQIFMFGIVGEYIGRIYEEVKSRPLFIIRDFVKVTESHDMLKVERKDFNAHQTRPMEPEKDYEGLSFEVMPQ
jgi:dolichol-phosphate mannosyltransferase